MRSREAKTKNTIGKIAYVSDEVLACTSKFRYFDQRHCQKYGFR